MDVSVSVPPPSCAGGLCPVPQKTKTPGAERRETIWALLLPRAFTFTFTQIGHDGCARCGGGNGHDGSGGAAAVVGTTLAS